MKKKIFTMHPDIDAFIPATDEEKEYMVQMRPSSTFFKDGVKRLLKNKVATASLCIIVLLTLTCIFLPLFWPYGYDQMLGQDFAGRMDASYNNLAPGVYSLAELVEKNGKVNGQQLLILGPAGDAEAHAAAKVKAETLLADWQAAGGTAEAFTAMVNANFDAENASVVEKENNGAFDKADHKDFATAVSKWIWEGKAWSGKLLRTPGEAKVIESDQGYHIVYIAEYVGGGEKVFPHVFGTDAHGRDYLIRVVYGMRVSLAVGLFASIIVLIIGMLVGSIAGYCGGKVDLVIMRIVDIIYSLPDMLMVILLASVLKLILGEAIQGTVLEAVGSNIISLFIVFGLLYWVSMSRLIRGQILSLREQEYVLSARASGARSGWIIRKHLIPNCISVIIISTALQIPSAIFTESYLSFLGLGVNAPMPSLGSLASDALNGVESYSYRLIIPAIVISLIVLSLNLLGDGLRDAFDPKLNG